MNYCEGCDTLTLDAGCGANKYNLYGKCPCTKCIVKPMCKKACEPFLLWQDLYIASLIDH